LAHSWFHGRSAFADHSTDAKAGEAFFSAKCASCHSPTDDLRGLATKIADERLLQQTWLMPGSGGGRGGRTATRWR